GTSSYSAGSRRVAFSRASLSSSFVVRFPSCAAARFCSFFAVRLHVPCGAAIRCRGKPRGHAVNSELFQFSTTTVLLLLFAFYGGTYLLSTRIKQDDGDADGFMV